MFITPERGMPLCQSALAASRHIAMYSKSKANRLHLRISAHVPFYRHTDKGQTVQTGELVHTQMDGQTYATKFINPQSQSIIMYQ